MYHHSFQSTTEKASEGKKENSMNSFKCLFFFHYFVCDICSAKRKKIKHNRDTGGSRYKWGQKNSTKTIETNKKTLCCLFGPKVTVSPSNFSEFPASFHLRGKSRTNTHNQHLNTSVQLYSNHKNRQQGCRVFSSFSTNAFQCDPLSSLINLIKRSCSIIPMHRVKTNFAWKVIGERSERICPHGILYVKMALITFTGL